MLALYSGYNKRKKVLLYKKLILITTNVVILLFKIYNKIKLQQMLYKGYRIYISKYVID